ncbi:transmembrane protein 43-like, partial [Pocillopora damicornis]|uniref:transmembrane protein 43-like n=1 Tax=Pocillopora damicornis TaxID=46731 RepID=UPI000F551A88
LFGILLVIVSFPVLYWNEGRAVQTALSLDEGLRQVVHIHDIDQISSEYQDKLVHLSGSLQTDRVLSDSDYGIAVKAARLRRNVEMYQWVEHKHTGEHDEGGQEGVKTVTTYTTEWSSISSVTGSFAEPGHQNPKTMPVQSYTKEPDSVRVGAFSLSKELIRKIDAFQPLSPREVPQGKMMNIHNGMFYHSTDPSHPIVGDVRVQFSYAGLSGKPGSGLGDPMKVSIVARQQDGRLSHYHSRSGNSLELLYPGEMSAEEIFEAKKLKNVALTWVLRVIFLVLMILGFMIIEAYNGLMMACILTALSK